ncbi:unnamed protein product [Calypogeia fissa]
MVPNVELSRYATRFSEKWDSVRADRRTLIHSLQDNLRLMHGLPDDIVRDYIWPVLHERLISKARTDDETRENIRFLLSLMSFNKKWRHLVTGSSFFGIIWMMRVEFLQFRNLLTEDEGIAFVRQLMGSFPNMHLLGSLESTDLDEFWIQWTGWDLFDRMIFMENLYCIEGRKLRESQR